ncbi:prephenate/arogenate dehydrogenase family protein [Hyphococcus flavus]|uniref:prephenate dehydrogenase n=1 Tax=Hyphococcus flavus TaxID=1866326 RepID=A0AAE9ZEH2_9PROT|nr:prephenate/arogenate dehydrogenase family protein [Hyphococcus flavus]WDI33151.1 prephenate/arogenate dehydrogenase family protein [Hyphococcus flavus]
MTEPVKFKCVAIIGVGLIGSSLACAMRKRGLTDQIIGVDCDEGVLARAKKIGVIDDGETSLEKGVSGADLIVLSTPVGVMSDVCKALSAAADDGALIIDVGSVKGSVAKAAAALPERLHFVPCHPVAGTEQSGPEAGFASLFEDRWCILTPLVRDDEPYKAAVKRAEGLWAGVGAQVEVMDAAHHDLALAVTSHLPHLIAFTLVGAADDVESVAHGEVIKYSAGGFRDFTRIAASDPIMWRDVFLANKDAVLEVLGRFSEELAVMQRAIRWSDGKALEDAFARGRSLRRAIVDAGQEMDAPNFGRDKKER